MSDGIIDIARNFSDRESEVRSVIGHYAELVMHLGTLIQEARFRSEGGLKWRSVRAEVETLKYQIESLHKLGGITDYDFERGKHKVEELMSHIDREDAESLEFSAREMWTYVKDVKDSMVPYCLNPKAVAKKRQVVDS